MLGDIKPASKYLNDVILSSAKNLVFSCCYEILHFVQDDHYNWRVNNNDFKIKATLICKIPPNLPLPKGGIIPLFGKEGEGEIF